MQSVEYRTLTVATAVAYVLFRVLRCFSKPEVLLRKASVRLAMVLKLSSKSLYISWTVKLIISCSR